MRTLVVSDLHLGNRARRDVTRLEIPRARLLEALDGIDRLVVLGDLAELMNRHPQRSLAAAEPVVRAIGRRLGAGREVLLIPGNHDTPLIRAWARAQGRNLRLAAEVPPDASPALARMAEWLAPAAVSVRYPGAWLSDGVFAMHGHYLDRHLMPVSAFGMIRPARGRDRRGSARPSDYERARTRRSREPVPVRFLRSPLATTLEAGSEFVRIAALPVVPRLLMNARMTPINASLIDLQMRRSSIPAMARVARRLDIEAEYLIFGHVHRSGPSDDDGAEHWRDPESGIRFLNTGSWLYEPLLVDRITPPHPYWPGGAVALEPGRPPRALNLLEDVAAADLQPPPPR